jgi:hypothetical protein
LPLRGGPLGRVKPKNVFFLVCGIKGHFLFFFV